MRWINVMKRWVWTGWRFDLMTSLKFEYGNFTWVKNSSSMRINKNSKKISNLNSPWPPTFHLTDFFSSMMISFIFSKSKQFGHSLGRDWSIKYNVYILWDTCVVAASSRIVAENREPMRWEACWVKLKKCILQFVFWSFNPSISLNASHLHLFY